MNLKSFPSEVSIAQYDANKPLVQASILSVTFVESNPGGRHASINNGAAARLTI
jgi:hypothetical protein